MNDRCWCGSGAKLKRCHLDRSALEVEPTRLGSVSPMRSVPDTIARPHYVTGADAPRDKGPQIHDPSSLERMRHAGTVGAEVLRAAIAAVAPGVTSDDLDEIAHDTYVAHGAYPSTLGYNGYPKSVCISVNEVICHGIPDDRPLREGDIVNIDVTAFVDGMHGDTSATVGVGTISDEARALIESTRMATLAGIGAIRAGRPINCIGAAIEELANDRGYGIVAEYGGHGIGEIFHAAPHVNHTYSRRDTTELLAGMTLTVEPMFTTGRSRFTTAEDAWTEVLDDPMPSAQFEHTVLVTDDGAEILTVCADGTSAVDAPVGAPV